MDPESTPHGSKHFEYRIWTMRISPSNASLVRTASCAKSVPSDRFFAITMVAELEEPRPVAAVVRPPPGGKGQAGSARGEGIYLHVLSLKLDLAVQK